MPFSQTLAIRRRPNLVPHRGGTAIPAFSPTPMVQDAVCAHVEDDGQGNPKENSTGGAYGEGAGSRAGPLAAVESAPNVASAGDPVAVGGHAADSGTEGVGWGEEALSLPSCVASSAASLSLLHLGAEAEQRHAALGGATDGGARDDSNRGTGLSSVAVRAAGASRPEYEAGAGVRTTTAAASAAEEKANAAGMAPHEARVDAPGSVGHRASDGTAQGIQWVDSGLEGKGLSLGDISSGQDTRAVMPGE